MDKNYGKNVTSVLITTTTTTTTATTKTTPKTTTTKINLKSALVTPLLEQKYIASCQHIFDIRMYTNWQKYFANTVKIVSSPVWMKVLVC